MRDNKLWKLFTSTLYLSAFTFGGGYVIVSLMKQKFVDEYHWLTEKKMLNYAAIAQSAPGAIAVNAAIVVGYRVAGILGIFISVIGTIIPPFVIIASISFFYTAFRSNTWITLMLEGMQAGVGAVVAAVSYDLAKGVVKEKNILFNLILVGAFIANAFFDINVVYIMLFSIIAGLLLYFVRSRGELTQ